MLRNDSYCASLPLFTSVNWLTNAQCSASSNYSWQTISQTCWLRNKHCVSPSPQFPNPQFNQPWLNKSSAAKQTFLATLTTCKHGDPHTQQWFDTVQNVNRTEIVTSTVVTHGTYQKSPSWYITSYERTEENSSKIRPHTWWRFHFEVNNRKTKTNSHLFLSCSPKQHIELRAEGIEQTLHCSLGTEVHM